MRIFKNAWFERFARKQKIRDTALREAVQRAEQGLIDADLGGGIIKQRVARPGQAIDKLTMREFDDTCLTSVEPLSPEAIRALLRRRGSLDLSNERG